MEKTRIYPTILFLFVFFIINASLGIAAADCTPNIAIPEDNFLKFDVKYGKESYFNFTITEAADPIDDGYYDGWCVQKGVILSQESTHTGKIYSSYDVNIPDYFSDIGLDVWKKINYLLNNRESIFGFIGITHNCSVNREDIQDVIWNLTCDVAYNDLGNCSRYVIDYLSNDSIQTEIDEFCPQPGDILVVLIDTFETEGYSVQKTIFELPITYDQPSNSNPPSSDTPNGKRVNIPPTADGSKKAPYRGVRNEPIIFDGSRSYDYDGWIISWDWSFGDGTIGSGEIVNHNYSEIGIFLVYLNVTDNDGAIDSYTTSVEIVQPNHPPSIPIITGETTVDSTTFYDYSFFSIDADNDSIRYIVDWGDGFDVEMTEFITNNTSAPLRRIWDIPGVYTIQVTAEDSLGAVSVSSEKTIFVDVDVYYVDEKKTGYFMDYYKDGILDKFYDNDTGSLYSLETSEDGWYLMDLDGDGSYEYKYSITEGLQSNIPGDSEVNGLSNWFSENLLYIVIVAIIVIALIMLFVFFFRVEVK